MKRVLNINLNFNNRTIYTLVTFLFILIIGVSVYALTPGIAPNPGHLIDNVAPPTGCNPGEYLQWDGVNWGCADLSINTSALQERVIGSCSPGESIRVINSDGTVVCEVDDEGSSGTPSITVYQCPQKRTCDNGVGISGSWADLECIGQISSKSTCTQYWFNGGLRSCTNSCTILGKIIIE